MKRCPKCQKKYDDSLNFCLDDGSPLLREPDSEPTLISPTIAASLPPPMTGGPEQLPQTPKSSFHWMLLAAIILLVCILGVGAVAWLYRLNQQDSSTDNGSRASPSSSRPDARKPDKSPPAKVEPTPAKTPSLSGEWSLVNTVEKTSYPQYANLRLGYHIVITQTGAEFTAEGEKISENERDMDPAERTPIHVTGSIVGDEVVATFTEEGLRRNTSGRFTWTLSRDNKQLRGVFVSTAAKSSGPSLATREK